MCANMKEFQTVSEKIFELEQKKAKKKKEMDALEKEIKQLKSERDVGVVHAKIDYLLALMERYFKENRKAA